LRAEERQRATKARLAEQSAVLRAMLDRVETGVVMVDPEGIVEVCNRRAVELLGLPEAAMARRPAFDDVRALHWVRSAAGCRQIDGRIVAVQSIVLAGGAVLHTFSEAS
jgi:PAS domain-containing protein